MSSTPEGLSSGSAARTRLDGAAKKTPPETSAAELAPGASTPRTRLDADPRIPDEGAAPTRLDGTTSAGAPARPIAVEGGYVRFAFPPSLAERLIQGEQIGGGGEAFVYRARFRSGEPGEVAVKLFIHAPTYAFELGSPEYARHFHPDHTVQVRERGEEGGQHWEVMEFCAGGTLQDVVGHREVSTDELTEIVREIAEAINSMHPYVHSDIKPSNILFRTVGANPDLVLADFGISVDMGGRSRRTNTGRGTVAYLPPGGSDAIRPANDWWALGMTILDLVLGQNVFQDERGRWLADSRISEFLATHAVPLDGVAEPRVHLLLRGLLQRNYRRRWGYAEVMSWSAGGAPEVAEDTGVIAQATATQGLPVTREAQGPFPFEGAVYYVPAELGQAMQQSANSAKVARGIELDALVSWLAPFECGENVLRVTRNSEQLGPQLTADLLAAIIQDEGDPIYRRFDLSSEADLHRFAVEASAGQLTDLYRLRPMYYFSDLLDLPELGLLDERWRDLIEHATRAIPTSIRSEVEEVDIRRVALLSTLHGEAMGSTLAGQASTVMKQLPERALSIDWFKQMDHPSSDRPGNSLAHVLVAPIATKQAHEIAMREAAEAQRERQERRARLSQEVTNLEASVERLRPTGRERLTLGSLLWPIAWGGMVVIGTFFALGIAMIGYSILSIFLPIPDGNVVAEWVTYEALGVSSSTPIPHGGQEWAEFALIKIYLANYGAVLVILYYLQLALGRAFGEPSRNPLFFVVNIAMLVLVMQPWAIVNDGGFPFTTNIRMVFLWPVVAVVTHLMATALWGSRKPQREQRATERRRLAAARSALRGLESQ